MNKVTYGVQARWWLDEESPATIGGRFTNALDRLGQIDPIMNDWQVWDGAVSLLPLAKARHDMAKLTANGVSRDDDKRPDPDEGYWISAQSGRVQPELAGRSVDIMINAGSRWTNQASVDFGGASMAPDLELMTYSLFRGTIEVLASTWLCPWVEAYAHALIHPPLEPATLPLVPASSLPPRPPREDYIFPWILYLSAPFASGLNPSPDLKCESTPGGGVILSAMTDRLDPANPDHKRRSRLLQAIIAERLPPDKPKRWSVMAVPPARIGPY